MLLENLILVLFASYLSEINERIHTIESYKCISPFPLALDCRIISSDPHIMITIKSFDCSFLCINYLADCILECTRKSNVDVLFTRMHVEGNGNFILSSGRPQLLSDPLFTFRFSARGGGQGTKISARERGLGHQDFRAQSAQKRRRRRRCRKFQLI